MTSCAIIEQANISKDTGLLSTNAAGGHEVVFKATYASGKDFGCVLAAAIKKLHGLTIDQPKVLILSAHGIPLTGTNLAAANDEQINLWKYAEYFSCLPPNLVVYVSACFGLFPSAAVIQSDKRNIPYVIGPIVDIVFEHANNFQQDLLDAVGAGHLSRRTLFHLIRRRNKDIELRNLQYGGRRWLFGMYDTSGYFFPRGAIGGQLAAPVEQRMTFIIRELICRGDERAAVACIVEDEQGNLLHANLGPLLHLAPNVEELRGKRFSARYQVSSPNALTDDGQRMNYIHILKARKR